MANTISAEWAADVDTTTPDNQPGWNVTLTYATAPGAANTFPTITATNGTVENQLPADADITATTTVFTFSVELSTGSEGADSDVTVADQRRVTLMNGDDLASTSIYLPQLVSITAPKSSNGTSVIEATITFAAPAAPVTGPPAVAGIGPAIGLKRTDITDGTSNPLSVTMDPNNSNVYKASFLVSADITITFAQTGGSNNFPHAVDTDASDNTAAVLYDVTPPTIGEIAFLSLVANRALDTMDVDEAFDVTAVVSDETSTGTASTLDLDVEFKVTPEERGADVTDVGETPAGLAVARITPKANTTTTDWPATPIRIVVTVTDDAGNMTSTFTDAVTLAAREGADPTAITIPTTALGMPDASNELMVTFSRDPGTVTVPTGYTISASGAERTITVPADKTAGSHDIMLSWTGPPSGSGTVSYTVPESADPTSPTNIFKFSVPAESYVILVRDRDATIGEDPPIGQNFKAITDINGDRVIPDANIIEWSMMPNLAELFDRDAPGGGGALVLRKAGGDDEAPAVGTVGISEIMWAIDASYIGQVRARDSQWIEIHNLNADAKSVLIYAQTGDQFTNSDKLVVDTQAGDRIYDDPNDDPDGGTVSSMVVDVMTNYFNGSDRGTNGWIVKGDNGSSKSGINFISMARQPNRGAFHLTRKAGGDPKHLDGLYLKTINQTQSRDGRSEGSWAASTVRYDRVATDQPASATTNVPREYDFIGTPGRPNTHSVQTHITRDGRTNVPASPVIINEVANRSNADYEWIELRNVTETKQNLRNMLISVVTSNSSDVPLIQMPNDDKAQIEPKGVFLLVASDPRDKPDHPLAVGWNVDLNEDDQVDGLAAIGITATSKHGRYRVVNFEKGGLPDGDGQKFVLILRSKDGNHGNRSGGNDGEGVAETGAKDLNRILDIGGFDGDLGKVDYSNAVSKTDLWPLQNFEGPASDKNRFLLDRVVRRQHVSADAGKTGVGTTHGDKKQGQVAFGPIGYSGIGYKRQASKSNAHGGTPGYHGNEKGSAVDAELVISELMLSQGTGRVKLPQWIEIYNPTDYAVQLDAGDGWRLIIENPGRDQEIRTINFKSKGDVKRVLPNETVLVVSYRARANIGHDRLPDTTAFPETRVFDVFEELKAEFEMDNRSTPILNSEAFRMTLVDGSAIDTNAVTPTDAHKKVGSKYYTISDDVGNLDGNARTNDEGMWKYPDGMDPEDGSRSSLIRVFDDRDAREGVSMDASNVLPIHAKQVDEMVDLGNVDGVMIPDKYSWVQAFQVEFGRIRNRTWFGDEDDDGTPATRVSQILPVELSSFRPTLLDGKVTIRWTTESELDNAGFNIYRSETRNGEYKQVNTELIQGAGTTGERNAYKWVDATAKPGVVYYYQIEDVSFAGEHQVLATTKLKGLISAKNKLTTTWGELKEVQ